ncbi:alkaline phosphatase D family protein [Pseudoalteromonas denitrificans]|uniref:Alkaline phosphatase D n=1 Tax=Pseudoalteromonas denitrificans DSM 6059 TaxID=1123010 RepID=A0A1I1NR61_9GAMM|nr:alkaline phosphatase D family protein [Pseudoalteromonas denitrificans]SFC96210.1 alkaline phosphatase D [Pseudoalteromonas denitrificans DSM 6059]
MEFTRRKFIKTMVISASTLVTSSILGCGSSNDKTQLPEVVTPEPSFLDGSQFFPQSVVSGDPKPSSVILWTRVDNLSGIDTDIMLQVSTDEAFSQLLVEQTLTASTESDHCIKIRLTELNSATYYYFRFIYQVDEQNYTSHIGRTKTAPSKESDVAVKFAYVSCQDYIGRYYNNYMSLLAQDDLDFVIHLGDYIYETTGDPLFQATDHERKIQFNDQEGALNVGVGDNAYQAANSIDNYRQLYKTYRSDELLQKVHERFPMIAIWDDHEFSDDSWADKATYSDGAENEKQTNRKRNSEIAYFDYMPIDHEQPHVNDTLDAGELKIEEMHLFPNTKIYRDFHFGKHCHIAMTDFRTNRPDHIIQEDAFPAKVELNQTQLFGFLQARGMPVEHVSGVIAQMSPYVNIDDAMFTPYKSAFVEIFTGLYAQELMSRIEMPEQNALLQGQQRAVEVIKGNLATSYLNQVLAGAKASLPAEHPLQQLPSLPEQGVEQGLAFYTMGKTSLFNYLGSRYFIIKDTYDLYAGYKEYMAQLQNSSVQGGFDEMQTHWLKETFTASTSTWKLLGSSVSFSPLIFDLSANRADSGFEVLEAAIDSDAVPAAFKQRFYLEADQWDGFPQFKARLIEDVLSANSVITLGGDVHSSYVTEHKANSITGTKSFNFTTSSVSSSTFGTFLDAGMNQLLSQLGDVSPAVKELPVFFDTLAITATKRADISDNLAFSKMWEHGVAIVEVNKDKMDVTFHNVATNYKGINTSQVSFYDKQEAYLGMVKKHKFRVSDGNLQRLG